MCVFLNSCLLLSVLLTLGGFMCAGRVCGAKAVDADCGALLFRLAFVTGAGGRVVSVAPDEQEEI